MRGFGQTIIALLAVFMGLALVAHTSAEIPSGRYWETQTRYSHVNSISWSLNSKYVAATSFDDDANGVRQSVAEMWDSSLENHRVFGTEDAQPISAALNKDGSRLFTGLSTGEIALWDTESSALLQRMPAHKIAPQLVITSNRNLLVSWDEDSAIIWDTNTFERQFLITRMAQTRESVNFVFAVISPDSEILALGNSAGVVFLYSLKTNKYLLAFVTEERGKPYGVFFNHIGELVLGYNPSIIKFCDTKNHKCRDIKLDIGKSLYYFASGEEYWIIITARNDGTIMSIDPDYMVEFYWFQDNLYNVSKILISPDEQLIAIGAYPGRLIIEHTYYCACF